MLIYFFVFLPSERCTRAGLSRSVLDFLTKFNGWRIWSLATLERDDFEKLAPTPIVGTIVYILCQQFVAFHRRFLRAVEYEKSDLEKICKCEINYSNCRYLPFFISFSLARNAKTAL